MVTKVILPKLAANVEEATISRWFKQPGDRVARDELLFEAITDKAAVEVAAEADGVLRRIYAAENSVVPVGQVIAVLAEADEELPQIELPARPGPRAKAPARVKASFGARRLAKELGVDLAGIAPARADGRITEADVRRAAEAAAAGAPPGVQKLPLSPLKRALAEHLSRTARTVAPAFMSLEVDFSAVHAARPDLSETHVVAIQPRDVVLYVASRLLPRHPLLNACFEDDGIVLYRHVNIGLALDVERDDAVLVPVIRDADQKSLLDLSREAAALARRLGAQQLGPADFADPTFTIIDQSGLGIDSFVPILHDRQSAILALSAVRPRPLVRDGAVVVAPTASLAVAFDHRVLNGASAARFLRAARDAIEAFDPRQSA